ncbi:hypothetical protein [Scytonema sp. PRP1]
MQSIKLSSRVGSDSILHLDVPVGTTDKELEQNSSLVTPNQNHNTISN